MAITPLHPTVAALDLDALMREALQEADAAGRAGDFAIGALLVVDGAIVARGRARHRQRRSQLAHAEMQALLAGGEALWTSYERAVLFTTLEPCPMCLGATVMADVPHLIFAAHDVVAGSRQIVETVPYVRRHITTYLGGVLEGEARAIMARHDPAWYAYATGGPASTGG